MASYQYPYAEIGVSEGPYVHTHVHNHVRIQADSLCFAK